MISTVTHFLPYHQFSPERIQLLVRPTFRAPLCPRPGVHIRQYYRTRFVSPFIFYLLLSYFLLFDVKHGQITYTNHSRNFNLDTCTHQEVTKSGDEVGGTMFDTALGKALYSSSFKGKLRANTNISGLHTGIRIWRARVFIICMCLSMCACVHLYSCARWCACIHS